MILNDKSPLGEADAADPDAPPAYNELEDQEGRFHRDVKTRQGGRDGLSGTRQLLRENQSSRGSQPSSPPCTQSGTGGATNKTWFKWFGEKDTRMEVKQTIQSLMRDVVKDPASPAAVSVLQSCLETCQSRGLSFQGIISEKFIEGHCPLYWAIVKRSETLSEEDDDDRVQLLDILLSIPLDATTRSEAYLACMLSSDQVLFQRLRHTPGDHSPSVSAAHELLIGDAPEDDVRSFDGDADYGEFRIVWKIAMFQKRMRAIGGVGTEVIARGRIWSLALSILPRDIELGRSQMHEGTWVASVSLLAPSPSTHLDAQFSIPEPGTETLSPRAPTSSSSAASPQPVSQVSVNPTQASTISPSAPARKGGFIQWASSHKAARKGPITLRVKTDINQLEALPLRSTKQSLQDHVLSQPGTKTLIVPLGSHSNGDSLQYDGCSYIHPDGSLNVILDGRLTKAGTGGECLIC